MNFKDYSNAELAVLISAAITEYQCRLKAAGRDAQLKVPPRPSIEFEGNAPSYDEQQKAEQCLYLFKTKGFVHAEDVREYRRIASKFPEWIKLNHYPDDVRGSSAQRWKELQL